MIPMNLRLMNDMNEFKFTNIISHMILEYCTFNKINTFRFLDNTKDYIHDVILTTGYYCDDGRYYDDDNE